MNLDQVTTLADIVSRNLDDLLPHSAVIRSTHNHEPVLETRVSREEYDRLNECLHLRVSILDDCQYVPTVEIHLA